MSPTWWNMLRYLAGEPKWPLLLQRSLLPQRSLAQVDESAVRNPPTFQPSPIMSKKRISLVLRDRCQSIRLLLLDVDGVLTDGSLYIDDDGRELKRFHVRDGLAVKLWKEAGGQVGIVSGRRTPAVDHRAAELGIEPVWQGVSDKAELIGRILEELRLSPAQLAYIGDDLPDLGAIQLAGLGITVADAPVEVRTAADYVTVAVGGQAAVREVVELILTAQGRWAGLLSQFDSTTESTSASKLLNPTEPSPSAESSSSLE